MTFIAEAIVILVAGVLVICLIRLAVRILAAIAVMLACLGLALLAGGLAGFCTQLIAEHFGGANPAIASTLVGIGTFVGALALMVRMILRRQDNGIDFGEPSTSKIASAAASPAIPVEEPLAPESDLAVRTAWGRALDLIPADTSRLRSARASCARLLRLAEGNVMDADLLDCATFVRRSVPGLVGSAAALWDDADHAERDELAAGLVSDLERLAERSQAEVARHRQTLRDNHHIIRTHVANRTSTERDL